MDENILTAANRLGETNSVVCIDISLPSRAYLFLQRERDLKGEVIGSYVSILHSGSRTKDCADAVCNRSYG